MASVNLKNISDHMRKIFISNFEIKSIQKVFVTQINNPHDFYVMPTCYKGYMDLVEFPGPQVEKQNIQIGAIVIFRSKTNNRPVRGQVYNINQAKETCELRAIDYGFVEAMVPFIDIFDLYQDLMLPPLAFNCQVIDCFPIGGGTWDPAAIEFMKKYVGYSMWSEIEIKGKFGDKYHVKLNNFSEPGVGMEMALIGLTQLRCSSSSINKLSHPKPEKHYFIFKKLKVGDQLRVRAVTGKELQSFYVAEVGDYRTQIEEKSNFSFWAKQCKPFKEENVKQGAAVLVYDGYYRTYERAIIKQILNNDKVFVQYIDNGIEKEVQVENLKELNDKFTKNTAIAMYCSAESSQSVNSSLKRFLYPGFEFKINILELGHGLERPHIVQLCGL